MESIAAEAARRGVTPRRVYQIRGRRRAIPRFSPAQAAIARRLESSGLSRRRIAIRLGVSRGAIGRHSPRLRSGLPPLPATTIRRIRTLYAAGETFAAIARAVGVSHSSARCIALGLRRKDVP